MLYYNFFIRNCRNKLDNEKEKKKKKLIYRKNICKYLKKVSEFTKSIKL